MSDQDQSVNQESEEARTIIARQAKEIEELRRHLAQEHVARELREALLLAATAGIIAAPLSHTRLLEMIVETAARATRAEVGFLFLIDRATEELILEVGYGKEEVEKVKKLRVPLGQGIAGLVAVSGQPEVVSDIQHSPHLASDAALALGYLPQTIFCVPLFYNDQTIGVLEFVDKPGTTSFSEMDVQLLAPFANLAAVAIAQSRAHRNVGMLIAEVLSSLGGGANQAEALRQRAHQFAARIEEDVDYREALELAEQVREIAWAGQNEFKACQSILRALTEYVRAQAKYAQLPKMESQ
jgi:GAF domain-containing protein